MPSQPITPLSNAASATQQTSPSNRDMFGRLWAYLRVQRVKLFVGLVFGTVSGLMPLGIAKLLKAFLGTLARPSRPGGPDLHLQLTEVCLGVVLIYVIQGLLRYGQSTLLAEVAQRVGMQMRRDVYEHLQSLSLAYFHRRRTGELMSTMTNDVSKLQDAAMRIRDVITTPLQVVVFLGEMFRLDWRLSLFTLLVLPAMAGAIGKLTRNLRNISDQSQQRIADVSAVMEETLSAPRIVRAFGAEAREVQRFERVNRDSLGVQMRAARRNARLGPVVDLIGAVGIALTLWVGGSEILSGQEQVGDLLAFIFLVSQVGSAVGQFGNLRSSWEEMMGAADRLFREVLDVKPDITDAPGALTLPPSRGLIEFDSVEFEYEAGKPTLQNVNLRVEPGQVVALVGQTGAGKSTLADLVPRFYDPTGGAVRVDGYDLRTITVASLRSQIGIVPQETLLFSGTIRDNIAYGRPDATDAEVAAAARAANADSFIQSLPEKYESKIGERGQTLSGGERQRIAIARALLADPRILILDEATSSLDASTEALVQEALDVLMQGRTTIVIAHRLSTIINADRIVVMSKGGRVAETGTHAELLDMHGVYAALYESQQHAAAHAAALPTVAIPEL